MKFLVFLALFSVLNTVYSNDVWVDLAPGDVDDLEVNQALNFGASNLTQDAIARGYIPDGTYHISAIESAQKEEDISDNDGEETDVTDDNDQDWDNNYRFTVEISNGEGSGLTATYTVHVDANTVDGGDVAYSFYISRYTYNWFTNQDQGEFGEDDFEWVHENEWNEFTPAEDDVEGANGSGNEVALETDDSDGDGQVLVVPEDGGEAQWVDASTVGVN